MALGLPTWYPIVMFATDRIDLDYFDSRLTQALRRITVAVSHLSPNPQFTQSPVVFLVGGCVRDALLGIRSSDLDLEIYGVAAEQLSALLQHLFPGIVNTIGRSYGILKIHLAEDAEIDIALPRRESKTAPGHTGFEITGDPSMSLQDASQRRDFTLNAIYADGTTGKLSDPTGGIADLTAKRLRIVDPATFGDDPLRVYRAVQFAARFDLTIDPTTRDLLTKMVNHGDLVELHAERITGEIRKLLLQAERPSIGFQNLKDIGVIKRDYPELQSLIGTKQEPEWHPEGDVWMHTLMVVDQAAKIIRDPAKDLHRDEKLQIMLGALCHDLGKPATTKHEDGRIRSKGHEDAGKEPTEHLCAHWTFGERTTLAAIAVAMNHLKPDMLYRALQKKEITEKGYTNAIRKLLKRISPVSWRVLVASAEADYRGRGMPGVSSAPYRAGESFTRIVLANGFNTAPTETLIQGRDLLAMGVEPGPRVGSMIAWIETLRDDEIITTRAEAISLARKELEM